MFLVGRSYKRKRTPAGPRIALYEHKMAFFYMRERVMHKNTLTIQILSQQSFPTFFTIYMTDLPSFVSFRGLVSEYWHCQIRTSSLPLTTGIHFFAYHELTLNYSKAFNTLYPLI